MDNREMIMKCALKLFCSRGYDAVGVQEIVDMAGITKPTLYYYFGSKSGLLKEILKQNSALLNQMLEEAVNVRESVPVILYRIARAYFDFAGTHREFYLFMLCQIYSGRETEGYQAVSPIIQDYYERLTRIFEQASDQLGNMRGRQEQFAVSFLGILDSHIMLLGRNKPQDEPVIMSDEKIQEIIQQFLYGIYT